MEGALKLKKLKITNLAGVTEGRQGQDLPMLCCCFHYLPLLTPGLNLRQQRQPPLLRLLLRGLTHWWPPPWPLLPVPGAWGKWRGCVIVKPSSFCVSACLLAAEHNTGSWGTDREASWGQGKQQQQVLVEYLEPAQGARQGWRMLPPHTRGSRGALPSLSQHTWHFHGSLSSGTPFGSLWSRVWTHMHFKPFQKGSSCYIPIVTVSSGVKSGAVLLHLNRSHVHLTIRMCN